MSESPYAEVTKGMPQHPGQGWTPVDDAMRCAYTEQQETAHLPAVQQPAPTPLVHQPVPLPEQQPARGVDLVSVRILATGAGVAMAGGGVDLAGHGIAVAGPYLWALAGALAALAGLIALIKGQTAGNGPGNTTVTISGNKNRIGRIG